MGTIASNYSFNTSIVKAIKSGCNLLIFSNNPLACKNIRDSKPNHHLPLYFINAVRKALSREDIHISEI